MSCPEGQVGYFVLSFDMELGWGTFDKEEYRSKIVSPDGSRERRVVELLLDILEEFGITSTWAVVGHLFFEKCEGCDVCPVLEWRGKYRCFEEIYGTDHPLWYGADLIESLLTKGERHEIAFHGYTHKIFDESSMGPNEARTEIQEWLRVSRKRGIIPRTVIFPRDKVGHLDLFREAGFICYRSDVRLPPIIRNKYFGRYIKHIDHILNLSSPPIYELNGLYDDSSGMVDLRVSQHIFGFNRRVEMTLDSLGLHRLRINRMIKGVRKAAEGKKVIHVWAHPWEFRAEKDFDKLRYLLSYVAEEMNRGRMRSIGMMDLSRIAMKHPTVMSNSGGEN